MRSICDFMPSAVLNFHITFTPEIVVDPATVMEAALHSISDLLERFNERSTIK